MASSSGTRNDEGEGGGPRRSYTRLPTYLDQNDGDRNVADSELVPSSLAVIAPTLRVANEIENDNPGIAFHCK